MRVSELRPVFVSGAPEDLEPSLLYVSVQFRTTLHLCACGCGSEVVLPLRPAAWSITYDGETVSMSPSVGNWSFPCRSHYWIRGGEVIWDGDWSDAQVVAGRKRTLEERCALSRPARPVTLPIWRRLTAWVRHLVGVGRQASTRARRHATASQCSDAGSTDHALDKPTGSDSQTAT